jgi:hypothetical protein
MPRAPTLYKDKINVVEAKAKRPKAAGSAVFGAGEVLAEVITSTPFSKSCCEAMGDIVYVVVSM